MRLLALEAGGRELAAALLEDGVIRLCRSEAAPQRHAERLPALVEGLLGELGWGLSGLDALAVAQGPGSFTGLRSSLAFAQGLALGSACRLYGVPSLEALAQAAAKAGEATAEVWTDARRGLVFRGRFARQERGWRSEAEQAMMPLEQARGLAEVGAAVLVSDLPPAALEPLPAGARCAPAPGGEALVGAVAQLAWARLEAGERGLDPAALDALYLRRSEAEVLWDKLHPPL